MMFGATDIGTTVSLNTQLLLGLARSSHGNRQIATNRSWRASATVAGDGEGYSGSFETLNMRDCSPSVALRSRQEAGRPEITKE